MVGDVVSWEEFDGFVNDDAAGSFSDLLVVTLFAGVAVEEDNVFARKEGRSDAYGLGALLC